MRDPHVVSLRYRVETEETLSFENPAPVERETDRYRMRLADGTITVEMKEHHASQKTARECVEPFVRAWELEAAIQEGSRRIRFVFDGAEIIDRSPPPPSNNVEVHRVEALAMIPIEVTARAHVTRSSYPEPGNFAVSPDVETMWMRYETYIAGRESLASMAFMCLSILVASAEASPEGRTLRNKAAKKYNVDEKVLSRLAYLTSEVGDERIARKVPKDRKFRDHTGSEKAWIDAVVRSLIRRVGEWAFDPGASLRKLTMNDFPKLS